MNSTDSTPRNSQILVVDDEPVNLRLLTAMLMEQGYEVRAVMSGAAALKAVQLDIPDIVLLDICMPAMDGYEVCHHLKADAVSRDIPIIFISALDEAVDKVKAFRIGGADYIAKPFQIEEVLVRVENQLTIQHTRRALAESEARYRAIVEDQTELICRFLPDFTLTFVNHTFGRYFGSSGAALCGQNLLTLLPEAMHDKFAQLTTTTSIEAPVMTGEQHLRDADGECRWVQWTVRTLFDQQGKVCEFQAAGRDITERVAAEEERRKLQRAVEQSPTSVIITDLKGNIQYANPKFTEVTGYTLEEARGQNPRILQAGDMPTEAYQEMWQTIISGKEWHGEFHNKRKDGELFWELASISPIFNTQGEITHFVAVKEDITDRKQMEEALQHSRRMAESATRAKSEFLANMSHEIRTPMNAVIGMTNLLLDTRLDVEQQDYVETIRISSEALLTLINDILDFSKIEAGKLDLEEHPFHLYDCVEEAIDLLAPQAAAKGLNLAYVIDEHIPCDLVGDMVRLRQILVNLLSNAVKFTHEGEIVVRIMQMKALTSAQDGRAGSGGKAPASAPASTPQSSSTRRLHDTPSRQIPGSQVILHITVRDTGIGIPPERLDRLFQSFDQLDAATTRKYGGTGLGLAISKRLAEMMGGTMWVESTPGQGSTFHVTLLATAISALPRPFLRRGNATLKDKYILIASDNTSNRSILVQHVKNWGMIPIATVSLREALDVLKQITSVDVALLDIHHTDEDSLNLVKQLRAVHTRHRLPVVLWTSLALRSRMAKEHHDPFTIVLVKPVRPSALFDALMTLTGAGDSATRHDVSRERVAIDQTMGQRVPLRILLAEDNTVNQKVARRMLEKLGYRSDIASNGLEVLHALERQRYDVILMDVQMPEMDGVEATRHVRTFYPPERQPCVVAMTAHALQGDREWLLQAGMDDYVKKPVQLEELVAALSRASQSIPPQSARAPATEEAHEASPSTPNGERTSPAPPEPPELEPRAPVDTGVLHDFLEMVGATLAEEVNEWLNLFLHDASSALTTIQLAVQADDRQQVMQAAHTLKSSSAQIGAYTLSHHCQQLEAMGRASSLKGAAELVVQTEAEYLRVKEALGVYRTMLRSEKLA